jgi:hypothetical protein
MVPNCPFKIEAKGQDMAYRQLENIHNMDDDGKSSLKTEIKLREQNSSLFS